MSGQFASLFHARDWAEAAGLWHDLGKYSNAFQAYLRQALNADYHLDEVTGRIDHSTAGAKHAVQKLGLLGHPLAYVIAGHHSGLLDGRSDGPCLEARLAKVVEDFSSAPDDLLEAPSLQLPERVQQALARHDEAGFVAGFFTRMLFSCLVDADFLDTEHFMDPERASSRLSWPEDILARMERVLNAYVSGLQAERLEINTHREEVRRACLEAAAGQPGLFSLTVPTGGGKTLSSLAFALRHALTHGLQRIVYVVPFTTIIEQTADRFREVFAPLIDEGLSDPIVEHHYNVDVGTETVGSRLATENWCAPVVVTTSVQFYESLFANRTSRCRKLHNLCRSVIVLDEAQAIPVDSLRPCLAALEQLVEVYGASIVLCTATQPAIHRRANFSIGLEGVREIIPNPVGLYNHLKRVEVVDAGSLDDASVVGRLRAERQVLCVVNTRRHARLLYEALGGDSASFHLSALMCPEHRTCVLNEIHERLKAGEPCRVISTQLIEAGVDIDFPVVYRSLAGVDSIAQAAGRCNRNGLLDRPGETIVFRSEHQDSERFLRDTTNAAAQVLSISEDILSLEAIERYFQLYYWDQSARWDARQVMSGFKLQPDRRLPFSFDFEKVARSFRIIDSYQEPVIIPWGDKGSELCDKLRRSRDRPARRLLRQLQRFTVQIAQPLWSRHLHRNIELVNERHPILIRPDKHYWETVGLHLDDEMGALVV